MGGAHANLYNAVVRGGAAVWSELSGEALSRLDPSAKPLDKSATTEEVEERQGSAGVTSGVCEEGSPCGGGQLAGDEAEGGHGARAASDDCYDEFGRKRRPPSPTAAQKLQADIESALDDALDAALPEPSSASSTVRSQSGGASGAVEGGTRGGGGGGGSGGGAAGIDAPAAAGVTAGGLPEGWQLVETPGEHPYYWHPESGEVRWEPPAGSTHSADADGGTASGAGAEREALPKGWQRVAQPGEHPYYWHAETGEVRWEPPQPPQQQQQQEQPQQQPPTAPQQQQPLTSQPLPQQQQPEGPPPHLAEDAKRRRLNAAPAACASTPSTTPYHSTPHTTPACPSACTGAQPGVTPPAMTPRPLIPPPVPPVPQGVLRPVVPPRPMPPAPMPPMQMRPLVAMGGPAQVGLPGMPMPLPQQQRAMPTPADQSLMEQTAAFIVSNGDRVISMLLQNHKLAFLHPTHPHNGHFCLVLDGCRRQHQQK